LKPRRVQYRLEYECEYEYEYEYEYRFAEYEKKHEQCIAPHKPDGINPPVLSLLLNRDLQRCR